MSRQRLECDLIQDCNDMVGGTGPIGMEDFFSINIRE